MPAVVLRVIAVGQLVAVTGAVAGNHKLMSRCNIPFHRCYLDTNDEKDKPEECPT